MHSRFYFYDGLSDYDYGVQLNLCSSRANLKSQFLKELKRIGSKIIVF